MLEPLNQNPSEYGSALQNFGPTANWHVVPGPFDVVEWGRGGAGVSVQGAVAATTRSTRDGRTPSG